MQEFKPNLEPGNSDGHTVLRYLVEARQMPLEMAIEKVYAAVAKYAADYKGSQTKLMGGMILTGVLGLPIFFPFGITSLLIAGALGASAYGWQEFGAMRDRLLPEYQCLKNSVLLAQFIKWLAEKLKERRSVEAPGSFQPDVLAPAQIIAAYEHTVIAISNGEHLGNNASDPVLALFVLKLRQHTNALPGWVIEAFQQLESAERQRAADVDKAAQYMWGNLEDRYPDYFKQESPKTKGQNTLLGAVEVPAQVVEGVEGEGEQSLGKRDLPLLYEVQQIPNRPLPSFDRDRIVNESKGLMIIGDMGAAKTCVAQYIANGFFGYGIIIFDPHGKTDWGNAYVLTKMAAIYKQMAILLDLLENGDETPLLIICDEWLEIRGDRRNKKGSEYAGLADDFIRLFSTKPRKFNKLAGFVLHSPNVEAAGVDSFLRENYLKVHLGRLAKKEYPHISECAYPCVLEGEQQEHPTHGHHIEFAPKGKAPRNLQPLASTPINIPLAYMDGSEVRVCDRGWDGQLRLEIEDIRQRLELLLDSSAEEPNSPPESSEVPDTEPLNHSPEPLNQPIDEGCTDLSDGSQFSSEPLGERFTPLSLTKEQLLALIENLNPFLNQTQIIERLWQVKKGGSQAWKKAHAEFKQLTEGENS